MSTTSTTAMGLQKLAWQTYSVTVGTSLTSLGPPSISIPATCAATVASKVGTIGLALTTGTITSNESAVGQDNIITIAGVTYTFVGTLSAAPVVNGEVLIGANAAASMANLILAINRTSPGTNNGVKYQIAAANPYVSAAAASTYVTTLTSRTASGTSDYAITTNDETLTVSATMSVTVTNWIRDGMLVRLNDCGVLSGLRVVTSNVGADGSFTFEARDLQDAATVTLGSAPTVTLVAHAQQMVVQVPSGGADVTIYPANRAYGYNSVLSAGEELTLTSPHGAKFDCAAWYGKVASSTQAVNVMFI